MSNRDTSQSPVSDETAPRDLGDAFGGRREPLPAADESSTSGAAPRHADWRSGAGGSVMIGSELRIDASRHPNATGREAPSEPLSYGPDTSTGARDHPMRHTDADEVSTAKTDARDARNRPDDNLGDHYTGETAADAQAREDMPTRGTDNSSEASDAF